MTTDHARRVSGVPQGFTLIELLVTLTIIAMLIAVLLPSLGRARKLATHAASLSNARQLAVGHHLYHVDHDGHLMWGYPADYVNGVETTARDGSGATLPPLIAKRYPWRLIGYVSNVWDLVYHHTDTPARSDTYGLSIAPTYGLNSFYVGGDDTGLGFVAAPMPGLPGNRRPNYGSHAAYRAEEVRRPARLITFAEAHQQNAGAGDAGFYRVHPPKAGIDWWAPAPTGGLRATTGVATGVPADRYGFGTPTAFFDNHVASLDAEALMDMRHWADAADRPDWNFTP